MCSIMNIVVHAIEPPSRLLHQWEEPSVAGAKNDKMITLSVVTHHVRNYRWMVSGWVERSQDYFLVLTA